MFEETGWYNAQPDGILYLDNWLVGYKGSAQTVEITIKNGTKGLSEFAFSGCSGLTNVTIPNSVTFIGDDAFYYCTNLTSITIPNSVISIGYCTFYNCTSLTSITIPNSVTSIGSFAFYNCTSLTDITIPNSVTSIGDGAFLGCSSLTDITIPNSVTSFGVSAFEGCSSLTSIVVTDGNTVYDSRNNCNAIIQTQDNTLIAGCKNTIIPNSVTSIGSYAFFSCSGLTNITIPNSVTSIGSSAFSSCSGLTSINIPNSVTSIGNNAFNYCSGLTSVTVEMTTPIAISSSTFSNLKNATLYVPYGCKAAYQAADYWKEFKEIVEMDVVETDISTMKDAIYANDVTALKGSNAMLTICLKNAQATSGYSFDLVLPNGVSLAKDSENDYLYDLSSRHNGHSGTVNYNETAGVYSFAVLSLQSKEIKDSDGAIWTVKLKIDDNIALGKYAVKIQNAKYSLTSGSSSVALPDVTSLLTIENYIKGDANGDGMVDIADAVCIVNHIVGKATPAYVAAAADANGDGVVDIADAVRIVNLIVGKISVLAPKFEFTLPECLPEPQ